jgi:hypothetical protein
VRSPTVLRGGTSALFCYGYTGAGKTHTVFGVDEDLGMYRRASEELLAQIEAVNARGTADDATGPLMLHATVVEVHNDQVSTDCTQPFDRRRCAPPPQFVARGSNGCTVRSSI